MKKLVCFDFDMSIFSFQNGKLMTSGEGGALLTNNREYYEKAYLIQDVGRPKGDKIYQHVIKGANYRMNEFQGALLLAQMERVDQYNLLREKNSAILDLLLDKVDGIKTLGRDKKANIVTHYMYMFYYNKDMFGGLSREEFVERLNAEGIPCYVCFPALSKVEFINKQEFIGEAGTFLKEGQVLLPNSHVAGENVIWLHHRILEGEQRDLEYIVDVVKKIQYKS